MPVPASRQLTGKVAKPLWKKLIQPALLAIGGSSFLPWLAGPSAEQLDWQARKTDWLGDAPYAAAGFGLGAAGGSALNRLSGGRGAGRYLYPLGMGLAGAYMGKRFGRGISRSVRDWMNGGDNSKSASLEKKANWGPVLGEMVGWLGAESLLPSFGPTTTEDLETWYNQARRKGRRTQGRLQMAAIPAAAGGLAGAGYNWYTGSNSMVPSMVGALGLGTAGYFLPEIMRTIKGFTKQSSTEGNDMNNRRTRNVRAFLSLSKQAERGEGQGQGGPRQGDGGTSRCRCPECGHVQSKPKGEPCSEQTCNNCGHEGMMGMDKSALATPIAPRRRPFPIEPQAWPRYWPSQGEIPELIPESWRMWRSKSDNGDTPATREELERMKRLGYGGLGAGAGALIGQGLGLSPMQTLLASGLTGVGSATLGKDLIDQLTSKSASAHNVRSFLTGLRKQGKIVKDKGTNSDGEECEWAIKSHEDGHIISRHKTKEEAKEHLQRMKAHSDD